MARRKIISEEWNALALSLELETHKDIIIIVSGSTCTCLKKKQRQGVGTKPCKYAHKNCLTTCADTQQEIKHLFHQLAQKHILLSTTL